MRYQYTAIYRVKGIEHKGPADIELLFDANADIRAVLTNKPDRFAALAHEHLAVLPILAERLGPPAVSLGIVEQMRSAAITRRVNSQDAPHLVIVIGGRCEDVAGKETVEIDNCVVHVNSNDPTESIRSECQETVAAILVALVLESGGSLMPESAWDFPAIVGDDGRGIIPFSSSTVVEIVNLDPLADEAPNRVEQCYSRLNTDFGTVSRLLKLSLETDKDNLRSFLFGWTGIETFVNKVFPSYDDKLFSKLLEEPGPEAELRHSYVKRIRTVMEGKYRLADKFTLVALSLCPADADADIRVFCTAYKKRCALTHGGKIGEAELPTERVRGLLMKYLQLHLAGALMPATSKNVMRIEGRSDPFEKWVSKWGKASACSSSTNHGEQTR
jgi:hypothetical protein